MTPDEQHDIRNGILVIWRIAKWFEQNVCSTKLQKAMITQLCGECLRIGRAAGMSGIKETKPSWFERLFGRKWKCGR